MTSDCYDFSWHVLLWTHSQHASIRRQVSYISRPAKSKNSRGTSFFVLPHTCKLRSHLQVGNRDLPYTIEWYPRNCGFFFFTIWKLQRKWLPLGNFWERFKIVYSLVYLKDCLLSTLHGCVLTPLFLCINIVLYEHRVVVRVQGLIFAASSLFDTHRIILVLSEIEGWFCRVKELGPGGPVEGRAAEQQSHYNAAMSPQNSDLYLLRNSNVGFPLFPYVCPTVSVVMCLASW